MDARRRLLAALALGWTATWVARAAVSPVAPALQADLGLGLAELGLLPTAGVLGAALGYAAAGPLARRAPRASLLAGLALAGLATAAGALARGLPELLAAQAAAGVGEGLFFVPALALVARGWREGSGRAIGVLDTGISLGSALVLVAAVPVMALAGWRGVLLGGGAVALLVALPLLAAAVPRMPPEPRADLRDVLARRAWPLYASVAMLLAVYFALLYLAPSMLVARGFTLADADHVAALAVALGVPWHVLGGALADRHGAARTMVAFTGLWALAVAGIAVAPGALAAGAAVVVAYSLGIAGFVALMALVPRVLGHELAAPAFGAFWALGYLAGALGPVLTAAAVQQAGQEAALVGLAATAGLAALAIAPLARRGA